MVTSTLRSPAEQAALYAQGRKPLADVNALRAEAGMAPISEGRNRVVTHARTSVHEFGLAFDVALLKNGMPHWDSSADLNSDNVADYAETGAIGESLGLIWGGRFRNRDLCHFEWTGGLTLAELKAGRVPTGEPETQDTNAKEDRMDTEKVKAGARSTEFYMALLGAVIPVLNTHMGLSIPVEGVLGIAGVIISYIISRTFVKRR
jgi:peptidoglycan L-alanyl-D-glutamate endopeptidase CwlK